MNNDQTRFITLLIGTFLLLAVASIVRGNGFETPDEAQIQASLECRSHSWSKGIMDGVGQIQKNRLDAIQKALDRCDPRTAVNVTDSMASSTLTHHFIVCCVSK